MTDFNIIDSGSVVVIEPLTHDAKIFVEDNVEVEAWAWMGRDRFACDQRQGWSLLAAFADHGFLVEFV